MHWQLYIFLPDMLLHANMRLLWLHTTYALNPNLEIHLVKQILSRYVLCLMIPLYLLFLLYKKQSLFYLLIHRLPYHLYFHLRHSVVHHFLLHILSLLVML